MPSKPKTKTGAAVNPRIGYMTPEEFRKIGSTVLGGRGWQRALAHGTGWSPSTITRYLQGVLPVPKHVALLMGLLKQMRKAKLPLPDDFLYEAVVVKPRDFRGMDRMGRLGT